VAKSAAPPKAIEFASETQGEAFRYGPYPQVASGDWGSGKTFVYCLKALWLSTTFPKNRGVIARAVGKDLRLTTQQTFFKICTPSMYKRGRRNDSDGVLQLNNQIRNPVAASR
jgi:superfamily I DNA and RNA helicase